MKPIDVIILVVALLFVAIVVGFSVRRRKKGETGCGCDCGGCKGCSHQSDCRAAKSAEKPDEANKAVTDGENQE